MLHLKVKYSTTGRGFFSIPIVFSLSLTAADARTRSWAAARRRRRRR